MPITLSVFAALIVVLAAYGVFRPESLTSMVRSVVAGSGLWIAVAARLLLAILLWFSAPMSHTPMTLKVLAALAVVAAVVLPLLGSARLLRLVNRTAEWPRLVIRLQCALGVAFGVFLVWSVSPGLLGP